MKCPEHEMEVIPMWVRHVEVKTGLSQVVKGILEVTISKCPEFGCGYSIESDQHGVMIRDSKGNT